MFCIPFYSSILFFALFFQQIHGFAFITSQPRQCGLLRFDWVGGTPPFTVLIIAPFGIMRNVSIPAYSWNEQDQSGDFSYLLPLNQSQKVVFSMGDATGPTAGGVTDVTTIGAPAEGSQPCDTSGPSTDFTFETDLPLLQCKNFSFGQLGTAVQPISVLVTIPHGESFTLNAPLGDPFLWKANLTAGTSVIFTVKDAQNRVGGTSQVLNVGVSDESSCLGPVPASAPPTRLPQVPTTSSLNPSRTQTPDTPSGGGGSRSEDSKSGNKTALIVGSSVGGAVGLLVIIALIFCLAKRKGGRNGVKPNDLHGSAPGVSKSFLPPGQMQYHGQVAHSPYFVDSSVVASPTSRSNGSSSGQMQYHDQVAPTPYFINPSVAAQPTGRSNGFPPSPSTVTSVWSSPNIRRSSATAAMPALAGTEVLTGTMDTKFNHSAMSFNQEAMQQQGGRHLYFDPYARNRPQQDYDFDHYIPISSSSQKIGSMSWSGAGPVSNTGTSAMDSKTASPQTGKLPPTPSVTTQPPRHLIVHTDMEDEGIELPPVYSDSRTCIPGLPSAAHTGSVL